MPKSERKRRGGEIEKERSEVKEEKMRKSAPSNGLFAEDNS